MRDFVKRFLSFFLVLAILCGFILPTNYIPEAGAANLASYLYQLPSATKADNGRYRQNMSYVIKTRRNKIIVIDGGYVTENSDAEYLLDFLKDITGNAVPNVDMWFFTHPHEDHIGAFQGLAARHANEITVDTVYYNFPSNEQLKAYCPSGSVAGMANIINSFEQSILKLKRADGSPVKVVEIQSRFTNVCRGSFAIDTAHFEVLLTCDEIFTAAEADSKLYSGTLDKNGKAYTNKTLKQLINDDFGNNTSCVIRMSVGGKDVLFMGDLAEPGGIILRSMHDANAANSSKYFNLKSDIVQMAHHGQNAVPKSVYDAIQPSICLWPTPDWVYSPSSSSALTTNYTKKWISALGATSYVSKDGLKTIEFPDIRSDTPVEIPEELRPLVFDASYYESKYPDLKAAYNSDADGLYYHFINYGIEEGRSASPFFDVTYYMSQNSHKMLYTQKGNYLKGFAHFLRFVYEPGELTAAKKMSPIFDCKYYYKNNPDLSAMTTEFEVMQHFVTKGYAEGRKGAEEVKTLDNRVYHKVKDVEATSATCTSNGYSAGKVCATCGETLSGRTVSPATGHKFEKNVCTVCGYDRGYVLLHFQSGSPELNYSWQMNDGKLPADPYVDINGDGAMQGYITNTSDAYVKMVSGMIGYKIEEGDIIQLRVCLSNKASEGLLANTGATSGTLVFNQKFKAFLQTSANINYTGAYCTDSVSISGLKDGEYGIVNLKPAQVCVGTTLEMIRFDLLDGYGKSVVGTFCLDYLYVGPAETAPVLVKAVDANDNTLYARYHGYNTALSSALPAPSKSADQNSHYNFSGWQNAEGQVIIATTHKFIEDTVLSPRFTAEAHKNSVKDNADGSRTQTCQICGYTSTCTHHWNDGQITRNATCTETGLRTFTCECGASYTEEIAALGHIEMIDKAIAPSCTATGLTEGTHCSRCSEILIAQKEIPATGHVNTATKIADATCTEDGSVVVTCACGEIVSRETIAALGHLEIIDKAIAPSCTATGLTEGTHCNRCGEILIAQKEIPATGHVNTDTKITDATCTEDGSVVITCACGEIVSRETIAALGHSYKVEVAPPTCTEKGSSTYTCSACSDSYIEEIPATGHVNTKTEITDATCTKDGSVVVSCICGEIISTETVAALGHSYHVEVTLPTCTAAGAAIVGCTNCHEHLHTEILPALGHNLEYINEGSTHKVVCRNRCDYTDGSANCENGCGYAVTEAHSFTDGICVCGAVEITEPVVDSSLTFGAQLYLENDLTMAFRVKTDKLTAYDISTAYLVVERDVYESGAKEATVEAMTIREYKVENGRLIFSYPGIAAAQMNDAIRATFHIKNAKGQEYVSPVLNTSVATYLDGLLGSSASDTKMVTLIMDMLNYGAAAQVYFDRHADAPVNEAFESFKTYASYVSADFKTALENLSATENAEGKSSKLNLGLDLGTRIGIQYKVTVPSNVNAEGVTLVVTDAEGNVLETLAVAGNETDSRGRYLVNFYGFTSRDMRRVVYATAYANGEAITGTYAYSISTYAWGVQENAAVQPAELVTVTRAMMLYGDSAAAYFA